MLSKINTILLGLIAQKPLNPYEIQNILNKINIRNWFPIAESSVYSGIRSLHEKGWIQGEPSKESNMPEKTIYYLTEKGSEELKNSIEGYISNLDLDLVAFSIGIYFMCLLNKDDVTIILNIKLKSLGRETLSLKKQLDENSHPAIAKLMIKHRIYLNYSETRTIREILEKMDQDSFWNDRLALDWYEKLMDPDTDPLFMQNDSSIATLDDESDEIIAE
jgi:DNA-binding PadR family transcriptional regulator